MTRQSYFLPHRQFIKSLCTWTEFALGVWIFYYSYFLFIAIVVSWANPTIVVLTLHLSIKQRCFDWATQSVFLSNNSRGQSSFQHLQLGLLLVWFILLTSKHISWLRSLLKHFSIRLRSKDRLRNRVVIKVLFWASASGSHPPDAALFLFLISEIFNHLVSPSSLDLLLLVDFLHIAEYLIGY